MIRLYCRYLVVLYQEYSYDVKKGRNARRTKHIQSTVVQDTRSVITVSSVALPVVMIVLRTWGFRNFDSRLRVCYTTLYRGVQLPRNLLVMVYCERVYLPLFRLLLWSTFSVGTVRDVPWSRTFLRNGKGTILNQTPTTSKKRKSTMGMCFTIAFVAALESFYWIPVIRLIPLLLR